MSLPILCIFGEMGAVLPLETEDQLEQALYNRQVIVYASQDAATPTALPSPSPIPQSHLFLQESAGGVQLAAVPRPESSRAHPSCFYDLGATDYPSDPFLSAHLTLAMHPISPSMRHLVVCVLQYVPYVFFECYA